VKRPPAIMKALHALTFLTLILGSSRVIAAHVPFLGPPTTYASGDGPVAIAVGDFNNDGRLDVVTANQNELYISILIGGGQGALQQQKEVNLNQYSFALAVGDFNQDGNQDLAVAVLTGYSILLGNGDGTFQPPLYTHTAVGAIAAADVNGDGKLDFIYTTSFGVDVQLGNGDGTFQSPLFSSVNTPFSLQVVDVNGDGKPDLLGEQDSSFNTGFYVLIGKGNGTFNSPIEVNVNFPGHVAAADFNGDGKLDVAMSRLGPGSMGAPGAIGIFLGNGDGTFQPERDFDYEPANTAGYLPGYVVAADFNGDGKLDVAIADGYDRDVSVILGNGDGTFQFATQAWSVGAGPIPALGDFNGDGLVDIATANYADNNVSILLNHKTGFSSAYDIYDGGTSAFLVSADFNSDGKSDLAFGDTQGVGVALSKGQSFGPTRLYPLALGDIIAVAAGDLNGDGHPDLVALNYDCSEDAKFGVLLGKGDGTLSRSATYEAGVCSNAIALADFNNDGHLDVAVSNGGDGTYGNVSLLLGNGDGTLQLATTISVGKNNPAYFAVGDFNGDGNQDLALINQGQTATVDLLLGNGDGTFRPLTAAETIGIGLARSCAAADLNHDGKLDLVVVTESQVIILIGDGDGTFQSPIAYNISTYGIAVAIADFDGDGNLDLAVDSSPSSTSGTFSFFSGNGDGTFKAPQIIHVGVDPLSIATGDFNGDGKPDVAINSWNDGTATILLNTGH
jgi:hypothetical protein